jgi:hypothetical protein
MNKVTKTMAILGVVLAIGTALSTVASQNAFAAEVGLTTSGAASSTSVFQTGAGASTTGFLNQCQSTATATTLTSACR